MRAGADAEQSGWGRNGSLPDNARQRKTYELSSEAFYAADFRRFAQ